MTGTTKRRSRFSRSGGTAPKSEDEPETNVLAEINKALERKQQKRSVQQSKAKEVDKSRSFTSVINVLIGVLAMLGVSYVHSRYMYQIHENQLWFTNIKVRLLLFCYIKMMFLLFHYIKMK